MKFPFLLLIALTVCACTDPNDLYTEEIEIADNGWTYSQPVDFKFDIADTSTTYAIDLSIDFKKDYAYQNLYVRTNTIYPTNEIFHKVLSFDLASKSGQWRGECSGGSCVATFQLQKNARFPKTGTYTIQLEQFMRIDSLANVNALSMNIRSNTPQK